MRETRGNRNMHVYVQTRTCVKGLGACVALLCMSHTLQNELVSGQEASISQIDFSAAFDSVNHQGILQWLCSVGIRGSVLSKCMYTVSIKLIAARYGGGLSEYTGEHCIRSATEQCFVPVVVPPVPLGAVYPWRIS